MSKKRFIDLPGLSEFKSKIMEFILSHEYTHPTYTPMESGIYKITVDKLGHIISATAITKTDIISADIFPEYEFSIDDNGELTYSINDNL